MSTDWIRVLARSLLPAGVRARLRSLLLRPPLGKVSFGDLRRTTPIDRRFGLDRGLPIDRHYIEAFLRRYSDDIKGRVLEIGDPAYTLKFGGSRVTRSDVLHALPDNPRATLVGNLATGEGIPEEAFDCIILTQTLLCIFDCRGAVKHAMRALRPGGVILATVPGISQISRYDMDRWGDYWRFTTRSIRLLFEEHFSPALLDIHAHGNVLAAVAFLHGLAVQDLQPEDLAPTDPDYELLITVRAQKAGP